MDRSACPGFGIVQHDLQFFLINPDCFPQRHCEVFEPALDRTLVKALKIAAGQAIAARIGNTVGEAQDLAHLGAVSLTVAQPVARHVIAPAGRSCTV